jgi:hypothetical protein
MTRAIAFENLREALKAGTRQGAIIRADFVRTDGFRQRANRPARLGIKSFGRTASGTVKKFLDPDDSLSQSRAAKAGSDCFDA